MKVIDAAACDRCGEICKVIVKSEVTFPDGEIQTSYSCPDCADAVKGNAEYTGFPIKQERIKR